MNMEAQTAEEVRDAGAVMEAGVREAMGEAEARVVEHLMFHRAIVREPDEREIDMDNYLKIVSELDMGIQVVLDDPVDRAVAVAFQLVIDEKFDPWNIDLAEFTKLYLDKIKKADDVNFIIAGRLVMMAWSILRSQSAHVLDRADREDEASVEPYFGDWSIDPAPEGQPGSDFSQFVLGSASPMLTEAVHSSDVRPVTLMNLIEAFDEAREEIALRERARRMAKAEDPAPLVIGDKLHGDSLQEDISMTWQRICGCDGKTIPMASIWNERDTSDKVTVFISSLFLAKMEKVELAQRKLPFGEIMITNIESKDMAPVQNAVMVPIIRTDGLAVV
jgi:segregation and condensation protein A